MNAVMWWGCLNLNCQSPLKPRGFLAHKRVWGEETKPNVREPLGAHVRSFECADPIRSRYWNFWVGVWLRNLTNSFWLDLVHPKDLTWAPRGSLAFRLFASCSFVSEKTSGFQCTVQASVCANSLFSPLISETSLGDGKRGWCTETNK